MSFHGVDSGPTNQSRRQRGTELMLSQRYCNLLLWHRNIMRTLGSVHLHWPPPSKLNVLSWVLINHSMVQTQPFNNNKNISTRLLLMCILVSLFVLMFVSVFLFFCWSVKPHLTHESHRSLSIPGRIQWDAEEWTKENVYKILFFGHVEFGTQNLELMCGTPSSNKLHFASLWLRPRMWRRSLADDMHLIPPCDGNPWRVLMMSYP